MRALVVCAALLCLVACSGSGSSSGAAKATQRIDATVSSGGSVVDATGSGTEGGAGGQVHTGDGSIRISVEQTLETSQRGDIESD